MGRVALVDPDTKAAVIQRAVEIGPSAAAKEAGLNGSTVRNWCSRAGVATVATQTTRAAVAANRLRWEQRRTGMVDEIGAAAHMALVQTVNGLAEGHMRNAKDAATTMAILVDKAQLLSGGATGRQGTEAERGQMLTEAHGRALELVTDAA